MSGKLKPGLIDAYVGKQIKRIRNNTRMTQEELGCRLDMTCQQIKRYEAGFNKLFSGNLYLFAQALGEFNEDGTPNVNVFFEGFLENGDPKHCSKEKRIPKSLFRDPSSYKK